MAKSDTNKPPTKTEIYANIAESTGVSKKDVGAVFEALNDEIAKALSNKGAGTFTLPGLCKIVVQDKPAVPEREGVNPLYGRNDHVQGQACPLRREGASAQEAQGYGLAPIWRKTARKTSKAEDRPSNRFSAASEQ